MTKPGGNFDDNNRYSLFALSNSDGKTPVSLWADPSTHLLQVSGSGGGGGTQYQELATTTPATGTLLLGRYQSSLPTLTNGQMNEPMLDSSSRLIVNVSNLATDGNGYADVNIQTNSAGLATSSNQTNGTQQTKITNGTNIADVVAGDTGFNSQVIANGAKTITFTTSASGAQTILANTNVEGYSWIEIVYTSVGSGLALTGQFSTASGGAYVSSSTFSSATSAPTALGVAVSTIYSGPIRGNYFQLVVSALTSGTFTGTVTLRAISPGTQGIVASQSGTWNIGGSSSSAMADGFANPTNNSVTAMNDVYNGTTWDRIRSMGGISAGSTTGLLATGIAGGLMPIGTKLNTYEALITTNATTTVTASTAYISSIVITVVTGQTGGNITITDGQGTPQTLVNGLSTVTATLSPTTMDFSTPIQMATGIKVITTSSVTAATIAVWINYYQ